MQALQQANPTASGEGGVQGRGTPAVPAPIASTTDPFEKIAQLKRLLDAGAITEEDFQKKKTSVLSQI
jgi:hypothetical protein